MSERHTDDGEESLEIILNVEKKSKETEQSKTATANCTAIISMNSS